MMSGSAGTHRKARSCRRRRYGVRTAVAVGVIIWCAAIASSTVGAGTKAPVVIRTARSSADTIPALPMSPSLHKLLPETNQKRGTLIFDTVPNPPWAIVDASGRVSSGVDVDLGQALAQVLGLKLQTVLVGDAATLLAGISAGRYDVFLGPLGITPARLSTLNELIWVNNTFYFQVQASSRIHSVDGMCGKTVAVLTGTIGVSVVNGISQDDCLGQGLPAINELSLATAPEAILAVSAGRADAYAEADAACSYALQQPNGDTFRCIVPSRNDNVTINAAAMAVARDNAQLTTALLKAMQTLRRKGVYQQILAKWHIQKDAVARFVVRRAVSG